MIQFVDKLPHVSMAAEELFHIGSFSVTNSLVTTWICMAVLVVVSLVATRKMKDVPTGLQSAVETFVEWFYDTVAKLRAGDKAGYFLPLAGTIFFFVLFANWMGLLPGFGSIGLLVEHHGETEFVPILRPANASLNTTLALALFSVIGAQIYGIRVKGFFRHAGRFIRVSGFINFFKGLIGRGPRLGASALLNAVIDALVGGLEILDEFVKLLSFSFRLFGNIFAGEVLLIVISMLVPYAWIKALSFVVPLPFMALEVFVGYIQALVFATLTLVFVSHMTHSEGH